jgi:hypothetical protein
MLGPVVPCILLQMKLAALPGHGWKYGPAARLKAGMIIRHKQGRAIQAPFRQAAEKVAPRPVSAPALSASPCPKSADRSRPQALAAPPNPRPRYAIEPSWACNPWHSPEAYPYAHSARPVDANTLQANGLSLFQLRPKYKKKGALTGAMGCQIVTYELANDLGSG